MNFQKHAGAVRRYTQLMRFGAWMQNLPNKLTPPPFRLMQISSAFWQSRALYVAAQLDIATVLADNSLSVEAIAQHIGSQNEATYRLLRMLASLEIFEEHSAGHFKNTKLSAFLREDNPQNVRAMILMHNAPAMSRPWYEHLEQGIRSGEPPFVSAYGEELYAYMDTHPELGSLFSRAMDSVESLVGESFATDFDWSRFERIIDVGGSNGSKSIALLRRHPHLKALVIDRPQVIAHAKEQWQAQGDSTLSERLHFEEGDVFGALPRAQSNKDIYLLIAVLHGFDDQACIGALTNLASHCIEHGTTIALMEMVVDELRPDYASTAFDMQMFMATRGKERTLTQWLSLFEQSGLALQQLVHLRSFGKILLLRALG